MSLIYNAMKSSGLGALCMLTFLVSSQLTLSTPAQASANSDNCYTSQLPQTIGINSVISENADIGQVIQDSEKSGIATVNCSAYYDDYDGRYCDYTKGWALVSDTGAVYNTGIPNTYRFPGFPAGIGYQALDLNGNPIPIVPNVHDRHDTGVAIRQGSQQIPLSIRLVKLDDSIPPVSDFNFTFRVMCEGNEYANRDTAHSRIYVYAHVVSVAQTCKLENPDIQVTLPTISSGQFSSVGDTGGSTLFALKLNCMEDAAAKVFFSDINDLPNGSSILAPGVNTTAGGISFQMRHAGEPVMLVPGGAASSSGTFINVNAVGGSEHISIPLVAEYIQSGSSVTAGKLEAQAMVTIAYD